MSANNFLLDSVKNLNYEELSKCRLISKKMNRIIEYHARELPCFMVTSAMLAQNAMSNNNSTRATVSEFGKRFAGKARKDWIATKGYTKDIYGNLSGLIIGFDMDNAIILTLPVELRVTNWMYLVISAPYRGSPHPKSVLYCSNLRQKLTSQYWPAALHFFRLLRHPSAFFRDILLFPFDFRLWEAAKWDVSGPVFCENFYLYGMSISNQLTTWLLENIRADNLELSGIELDLGALCDFALHGKQCARSTLKASHFDGEEVIEFVEMFTSKFRDMHNIATLILNVVLKFDKFPRSQFQQIFLEKFKQYLEHGSNPPTFWFNNYNVGRKPRMRVTLGSSKVEMNQILDMDVG